MIPGSMPVSQHFFFLFYYLLKTLKKKEIKFEPIFHRSTYKFPLSTRSNKNIV